MAALLRCSPPPPPQIAGGISRTLRRPLSSDTWALLSFRKQKVAMFHVEALISSWKSHRFSSSNQCVKEGITETDESEEAKLSKFFHVIMEYMTDHQRLVCRFPKAFVLAYSLVLMMPLKVLAETCEADNSLLNMPLLFIIALIGATVGGLLARQRKGELARLNDQLRQINAALRRQAKIESYAPNLSYAPVGRTTELTEVIVDPRKQHLLTHLRTGKNFLRNQDPEKAFVEFKAALEIAQALGDHVEEKKAARGLGASLQRQGKYKDAIKYHSRVLKICKRAGEDSGSIEAYGAIADCYTELGDLEQAGKFYDEYIARLKTDD